MKQRLISAFFGIILFVLVMTGNQYVIDIAVAIVSSVAVFEVISALGLNRYKIMTLISVLMPPTVVAISYIGMEYIYAVIFAFVAAFLLVMLFDHKRYSFSEVAMFSTISVMITLSFLHVALVRRTDNGIINVLIIFIGSWITDTCAYFTGFAIGKHKLAPSISPKKTIEGSIGGIVGVTVILTAYALVCANIMDNISVNTAAVIIVGLLCGVLSQLGDLCASVIKRENNIKDFGNIMPGHGGVMDRFDSLLFVAPAVFYLLQIIPVFS